MWRKIAVALPTLATVAAGTAVYTVTDDRFEGDPTPTTHTSRPQMHTGSGECLRLRSFDIGALKPDALGMTPQAALAAAGLKSRSSTWVRSDSAWTVTRSRAGRVVWSAHVDRTRLIPPPRTSPIGGWAVTTVAWTVPCSAMTTP